MERVSNILYNPNAFANNTSNASSSSSSFFGLPSDDPLFGAAGVATPLAAPPLVDEAACQQLARAIETGVAVPPEKKMAIRRWSAVKRNLLPTRPGTAPLADKHQQQQETPEASSSPGALPLQRAHSSNMGAPHPPPTSRRPRSIAVKIHEDD